MASTLLSSEGNGKYLITSRTGIEYVDPEAKHWELNHWVRGACIYGIMPANGMTYAPQHPCACYPESKLSGMNALVATQQFSITNDKAVDRLERGPAYDKMPSNSMKAKTGDWPLLRRDMSRSSYSPAKISGKPSVIWKTALSKDLSSPIVANGMLFVADKTNHTVFALNAGDGKKVCSFSAAGRVDSPPAYAYGNVVFGARDGCVYCLNATDGALRWRFLAAPQDKRLFNFEQLESVWPVSGSVLIMEKDIYVTAGRSIFLDGGISFYKLDLASGRILLQKNWNHLDPSGKNYHALVDNLSMPPANNDVLSSDGKHIYMLSQVLTMEGKRIMEPAGARHDTNEYSHIFSPTGLLDDSWWHRGYFAYGNGVSGGAGWSNTLKTVIGGKILCADENTIYSFGRKSKYNRWTLPLEFHLAGASKTQKRTKEALATKTAKGVNNGNESTSGGKRRQKKSTKVKGDLPHPFLVNWPKTIPI